MTKSVYTTHNVLRIFGIKIFEYYSDYVGQDIEEEDIESIRDDIILHENNIKRRMQ